MPLLSRCRKYLNNEDHKVRPDSARISDFTNIPTLIKLLKFSEIQNPKESDPDVNEVFSSTNVDLDLK